MTTPTTTAKDDDKIFIDERCVCPFLNHTLECTRKMLRENPRKWGEGLQGKIEILTQEIDALKSQLATSQTRCGKLLDALKETGCQDIMECSDKMIWTCPVCKVLAADKDKGV